MVCGEWRPPSAGRRRSLLTNQKGATLELTGRQTWLIVNLDLSGMALTLK